MNIKVLFFGITKDKTGVAETKIQFDSENFDLDKLKNSLNERFPRLATECVYKFAVNNEYVIGNQKLNNGDEVALIPPVSGG
jgi:molybdopterin synthase sulfur carrier subunit